MEIWLELGVKGEGSFRLDGMSANDLRTLGYLILEHFEPQIITGEVCSVSSKSKTRLVAKTVYKSLWDETREYLAEKGFVTKPDRLTIKVGDPITLMFYGVTDIRDLPELVRR